MDSGLCGHGRNRGGGAGLGAGGGGAGGRAAAVDDPGGAAVAAFLGALDSIALLLDEEAFRSLRGWLADRWRARMRRSWAGRRRGWREA